MAEQKQVYSKKNPPLSTRKKAWKAIVDYASIIALALLMAINYEIFIFRNSFAPSGINGVATMIQHVFGLNVGYISLVINIPLALLAFFLVDKKFALRSGVFVAVFSVLLILVKGEPFLKELAYYTDTGTSTILAPIAAATINGFVYGITLKLGGSTGGTDIIAALVRKWKPHISLVWIIFMLNVSVAFFSYFVYGLNAEPVILCIIYCYIATTVSDKILKGAKSAIKFEVITSQKYTAEISERLMKELRHGVTIIDAKGMYSHTDKHLIICVINKHQIAKFQEIVSEFPETFAYVSAVNETMGNFKKIH